MLVGLYHFHVKIMFKKILFFFLTLGILVSVCTGSALYWYVVVEPGDEIEIENIRNILGKESNVYYSDGVTKLGAFFDETHRQYVPYEDIPKTFVNALVAAEDNRFFEHFGFDLVGIGRAMIKNIEAGRIVQGGSTLTQQTAKNLFKRVDRSIAEKFKELLLALRLEYRYSKEQIFEFYANQFYVSGNGHGLGIAARYYFDKKPSELSLVESAFIAGSVKRPNYYNPFIKKTQEDIDLAKVRADDRLRYVLDKMKEAETITTREYSQALVEGVPFNKGQFGYELDYVMELVRDAVGLNVITDALAAQGVSNISTSGVSIITSIDKTLQDKTLYSLRQQLSELDVRLRGYQHDEVQAELANFDYRGDLNLNVGSFLFGIVESINGKGDNLQVVVSFGLELGNAVIDWKGLQRLTLSDVQWRKNRWAEIRKADKEALLAQVKKGDKVWVSVREVAEDGTVLLDLERYPKVQGGALVMHHGAIKSVAGGTENRFFNRAIYGKRTMGSAFKPFAYTAALQLGWNSADSLRNSRSLFVYQNQPYFPRPDHKSPFEQVSMSYAGIKSENLASVWLIYHLTDYLNDEQFHDLASHLGFTPQTVDGAKESYQRYKTRIRDTYGLQVTRDLLYAAAYDLAVKGVETDFLFDGMVKEYQDIVDLEYGFGYSKFKEQLKNERNTNGKDYTDSDRNEYSHRENMLSRNFLRAKVIRSDFRTFVSQFQREVDIFAPPRTTVLQYSDAARVPYLYRSITTGNYHFGYNLSDIGAYRLVPESILRGTLSAMSPHDKDVFWNRVVIEDMLTVSSFDMLERQTQTEYKRLSEKPSYDFEVISHIRDFRVTVGLHYLIALAKEMGVYSQLEPVLSFPLGSNVVTLLEAVRFYEGIASGTVWNFPIDKDGNGGELGVIDRIESGDGKLLYQAAPTPLTVVDPETSIAAGHILENVIKFGTGREANKNVHLVSADPVRTEALTSLNLSVPLLGKTGTANNYANASFLGYLPGINKEKRKMVIEDGYTVGVYVGYDDNKPMRQKSNRIAGSAGALPPWISIVNQLILEKEYADILDPVDLSFDGLPLSRPNLGQINLSMNIENGGLLTQPAHQVADSMRMQPSVMTFGELSEAGTVTLKRSYRPFWSVR